MGLFDGKYPAVLLAPMAGVTDMAFRELCCGYGAELVYTEMVSAKGLYYENGRTEDLLRISPKESPAGVQLFGNEPELLADMAAELCEKHGADIKLIDINMGCPARKIVKNCDGSALMRNPELASKIIRAVADAVAVPVTVKFRKGFDDAHINAVDFAVMAEQSGAAAVTVHGRTREQMYSGRADWDIIGRVKRAVKIPVIGNGDIFTGADAVKMIELTGCDGVMAARGAMGAPWIFEEIRCAIRGEEYSSPAPKERIAIALTHARRACELKGERGAVEMRKHIAWYVKGMSGAALLRTRVNACKSLKDIEELLYAYAARIS